MEQDTHTANGHSGRDGGLDALETQIKRSQEENDKLKERGLWGQGVSGEAGGRAGSRPYGALEHPERHRCALSRRRRHRHVRLARGPLVRGRDERGRSCPHPVLRDGRDSLSDSRVSLCDDLLHGRERPDLRARRARSVPHRPRRPRHALAQHPGGRRGARHRPLPGAARGRRRLRGRWHRLRPPQARGRHRRQRPSRRPGHRGRGGLRLLDLGRSGEDSRSSRRSRGVAPPPQRGASRRARRGRGLGW